MTKSNYDMPQSNSTTKVNTYCETICHDKKVL